MSMRHQHPSAPCTAKRAQDQDLWQAVCDRDPRQDGRFVYGVITTGVYCRPSCAARRPRRENVRFFASPSDARVAGLRACLRCRPDHLAEDVALVRRLCAYLEEHAAERVSLARLGREANMSPSRVQRLFTARVGVSPKAWQDAVRMGRLKQGLRQEAGVLDAIFAAGYSSTSRVYERLDQHLGMTPSAYRDGGDGEQIHYACRESALGPLMMAATQRGICFVQFADDAATLQAQLRREFPRAELSPTPAQAGAALDDWIAALDAHLAGHSPRPELPLDLRGTAFQLKVWRFLCSVPEGQVLSYGELARAMDAPSAARAVANACGANRVAVLVPCHRVLRGDGGLGGYRWGVARKRALLDGERQRTRRS